MKIAIVGIGGTGSATARHLAKAGQEVVGYEQFILGHDRGSSHGESRIIRYTYPDLLFTQMMSDAYPLWADLEAEAGEELLVRCGGVFFGVPDDPNIAATENALADTSVPYERLDAAESNRRFPALRLQPQEIALYQRDSGLLRATRCVLANARLARRHGATIREETPVQEIIPRNGQVIVQTTDGEEAVFDRVIVTAGAWMGKLFARFNLPLRVTRQQIVYIKPARDAEQFTVGKLPVWYDVSANFYGFPNDGRIEGVKLACHDMGEIVDPETVLRTVDEAYLRAMRAYAAGRFPALTGEVTHSQVCLYTNTPNEDFILDAVPDMPNVWLVSGCSGHGFKFTVLLGKIIAELATGGRYPRDLSRFALPRFVESVRWDSK